MDKDHDGTLTKSEVKLLLQENIGEKLIGNDKLVDEVFDQVDTDKSNSINFTEFLSIIQGREKILDR